MTTGPIFERAPLKDLTIAEVISALSQALDLTEGQPKGHCLRCCLIGTAIGAEMGLSGDEEADLYYTLLLKDLGCSSNAARICQLYLTDDRAFKQGFKQIDGSTRQAIAFVMRHTGPSETVTSRISRVVKVLKNADEIVHDLFASRCEQGAEIARRMHFSQAVCDGIAGLDEHWDGGGRPLRAKGEDIPLFSRIALVAQVMDVFHTTNGPDAALEEIRTRSGTWFDPAVVAAAEAAAARPAFWEALRPGRLMERVLEAEPAQDRLLLDDHLLDEIIQGFSLVIDAKSPFTHGHSSRVALYTDLICEQLGVHEGIRRWMRRTALMHDIGKLGVSNTILDKPAKLTDDEFELMKSHPVMSREILSEVAVFAPMAHVAAAHHERLDGAGYPDGLKADVLTPEMRILSVADVFDALSAERPYKAALPLEKVFSIMDEMSGPALDPEIVSAIKGVVARHGESLDLV